MINYIWFFVIASGILVAALDGRIEVVTEAIVRGAEQGITIALGLAGLIAFWSGMMRIAQESGLMAQLARTMRPIGRKLFPDVPQTTQPWARCSLPWPRMCLGWAMPALLWGSRPWKSCRN